MQKAEHNNHDNLKERVREACLRYLEEVYCHQIVLMPTESDFEAKGKVKTSYTEVLNMLTERSRQVRGMIPGPPAEETKAGFNKGVAVGVENASPAKTILRKGLTKSFAVGKRGSGEPMKPGLKERLFKMSLRQNNSQQSDQHKSQVVTLKRSNTSYSPDHLERDFQGIFEIQETPEIGAALLQ